MTPHLCCKKDSLWRWNSEPCCIRLGKSTGFQRIPFCGIFVFFTLWQTPIKNTLFFLAIILLCGSKIHKNIPCNLGMEQAYVLCNFRMRMLGEKCTLSSTISTRVILGEWPRLECYDQRHLNSDRRYGEHCFKIIKFQQLLWQCE